MFDKILIANRGEIALRIIRACKELNVKSVAVYSEADRNALHTRYANEAYNIGPAQPAQSYLNIKKIMDVAQKSKCEAIHPGYGFLSQIPDFAKQCEKDNISFIGPSSYTLRLMGNKIAARKTMNKVQIPVIPGSLDIISAEDDLKATAKQIEYPLLIKAVFGGGGKGLRIVRKEEDFKKAVELAKIEAKASFGNSQIYLERLLEKPRHIEFQILADNHGNIIHLGERECSIQRNHQKLIEETPSPMMTREKRKVMGNVAIKAAKTVNYVGAGTVEFLVDESDTAYFLEMNTRLQVEHLITEMVTGIDIVKEQICIAAGKKLDYQQDEVAMKGHALNCRINAENPLENFSPSPGTVTDYHLPGGPGVRVDTAIYKGCNVPLFYDSLIAKVAVWGQNRKETIARMKNALQELFINGIETTASFLIRILNDKQYQDGKLHAYFIDERMRYFTTQSKDTLEDVAILSAVLAHYLSRNQYATTTIPLRDRKKASLWKMSGRTKGFSGDNLRWTR
ncbi:MAG: acetyl-CoA carboxylase biotin carboxylase subunit [Candidatus Bathyarchaeota archaeon]|nr:MAG: acetyl-CoA carboxylase biotin carboxylase subunit [Candidatus Bathyarchaeota archaeon]